MFAFQDLRTAAAAPYLKVSMRSKIEQEPLFTYDKVVFGNEALARKNAPKSPKTSPEKSSKVMESEPATPVEEDPEDEDEDEGIDDNAKDSGIESLLSLNYLYS